MKVHLVWCSRSQNLWLLWSSLFVILILTAPATVGADDSAVTIVTPPTAVKLKAGHTAVIPLQIRISRGWHIFGTPPLVEGVKPSTLTVMGDAGISILPIVWPPPRKLHIGALDKDANVHENTVTLAVRLKADAKAAAGGRTLTGQFGYQACSDQRCLLYKKLDFHVPVKVVK